MRHFVPSIAAFLLLSTAAGQRQPFFDRTHDSKVLGEPRHYRIFLPADYESAGRSYPVIYYFHGHSDRYTLEHYDNGTDTVPKIAAYVASHPVIVVAVDGYVARDYTGFYGGSPWDVREEGGDFDFGAYFRELVTHIDATYRTLASRRYRATSGLSMGGFMSLYLSARYPDWIGSASAFNPGPELYAGEKGRRVLWRPKDHVANHTLTMVRLVRASGDYISQYHEETRDAYARASSVDFEYRQDEYHRHWATSIAETFDFHSRAFANPTLDNVPEAWNHANAYSSFDVWGYRVKSDGTEPGITYLRDVTQGGFRVTTRQWAPDGPPNTHRTIRITTGPLYRPGASYQVIDYSLSTNRAARTEASADADGRLTVVVDSSGHQISFAGPGTGAQPPVVLPLTRGDEPRLWPNRNLTLPVRIYNPRGETMTDVRLKLSSDYPTARLISSEAHIPQIESGQAADVSAQLRVQFTAGGGDMTPTRLQLNLTYDGWHSVSANLDALVIPEVVPRPDAVAVLDGRTVTLDVFRQKGNQGGGASIQRTVTEGKGNGNGVLEPGEEATIWVRIRQGLDPFDKNNWYRAKVYSDSSYVSEVDDLQEQKQLEWTGAKERTSLIRLAADTPQATQIPLLLDNESWSFVFTPDVRYGKEPLYQAFQRHKHHLHQIDLAVASTDTHLLGIVNAVKQAVDPERAMETMRKVWSTDRWFTFPKFEETASYLASRLTEAGLGNVEILGAPADGKTQAGFWTMPLAWDVKAARLEIIDPEPAVLADYQAVPTSIGMWCGPTPPGGITAEVVELKGPPTDAIKGKLVLTSRNPADVKWLLARHGALGAINAFTENPDLPDGRQWINAWGDNGWGFTQGSAPLLSFSITPRQAQNLRQLLAKGTVRVRATVDSRYYPGRYPYVTARLPGTHPEEEVLVLGHSSEQGANDNATGVSAMVEALATLRSLIEAGKLPKPRRSIRILTMPELYGSMHYVVSNPDRMKRTVAAIAVDAPAASYDLPGTEYTFHMNPEAAASYADSLILRVAAAYFPRLSPPRPWHEKEHTTGTDAYLGDPLIGVPDVWPYSGTGIQTHHNSEDVPATVDSRSLRDLTVVIASYLYFIASAGDNEARWLAGIAADRALDAYRGAPDADHAQYQLERGEDAVRGVLRLAPNAAIEPFLDRLRQRKVRIPPPPADPEAARIVVRRKWPGTIPLDDLPKDQWEGYPSGAWAKEPTVALYWCDGKRNLAEVIRLTRLEVGPSKFDFVGYFRFLEKHGYVEFVR